MSDEKGGVISLNPLSPILPEPAGSTTEEDLSQLAHILPSELAAGSGGSLGGLSTNIFGDALGSYTFKY